MRDDASVTLPNAALRALTNAVAEVYPDQPLLELSIRTLDKSINIREFSAYLALLDGLYGRLNPKGFRSYAQQPSHQLEIDRIDFGSIDLSFIFDTLDKVDTWRALMMYLILRAGPAILKGEAAKNWAEARKAFTETSQITRSLTDEDTKADDSNAEDKSTKEALVKPQESYQIVSLDNYSIRRNEYGELVVRLSRKQKKQLRDFMSANLSFSQLSDRHKRQIVSLVEEVLSREHHRIPASVRFTEKYVIEVLLRRKER